MLDPDHGSFDFAVAMDSLIHYPVGDIAGALARLTARTRGRTLFTVAPRTPLLAAMHLAGTLFPRRDRSPAIVPAGAPALRRAVAGALPGARLDPVGRIVSGFYISEAWEIAR
jgi:magnesium-protoporphyrin O-methyltransferase